VVWNGALPAGDGEKNWTSALEHCNSMKGRLVIIANAAEQQAVEDYLRPLNSQYS